MKTRILTGAIVALLFCVLVMYASALSDRLATLEARQARLKAIHAETLASLDALEKDRARTIAALEAINISQNARAEALSQTMKEIDNAPETDDAPVAPVLRRALDGLRD